MMAASMHKYAAFLTHDWGNDEQGRNNHVRVVKLATNLKKRGLPVWIDEHEMTGDVVEQMCNGIENSDVIIVFITQRYNSKVGGNDPLDNCKQEFQYAARLKKPTNMIPVVMEQRMSHNHTWKGPVGMRIGGALYVKMWDDDDVDGSGLETLIDEILKRAPGWKSHIKASPSGAGASPPVHSTRPQLPTSLEHSRPPIVEPLYCRMLRGCILMGSSRVPTAVVARLA
eukprot:m.103295 g.103295  ORF g.103295 m.103295 type:complete len:227 (-) comp15219_c0_seq5:105-785(-)